MIYARLVSQGLPDDFDLAFTRLGLPKSAREYLGEKVPSVQVLLTGLGKAEIRHLRRLSEDQHVPGREEYPLYVPGDVKTRPGSALLLGRRDQIYRTIQSTQSSDELRELGRALLSVLEPLRPAPLKLGDKTFHFGERTYFMGVVNVTPDSFSDGGKFFDASAAITQGQALAEAGADILDIGGESSRPGAAPVSAEEELRRVLPVLRGLKKRTSVPLSIDTTKAEVARVALSEGAALVNDITAFSAEPALALVVADSGAACCLMHMRGTPQTMQHAPQYGDVVEEIATALGEASARAMAAGIAPERILLDVGVGFGKTVGHNLFLLRRLADFRSLGHALVVGTSRKSFLGAVTGAQHPGERLSATLGSMVAAAVLGGADIVRVHDVAEAKQALTVSDAIRNARLGGDLF